MRLEKKKKDKEPNLTITHRILLSPKKTFMAIIDLEKNPELQYSITGRLLSLPADHIIHTVMLVLSQVQINHFSVKQFFPAPFIPVPYWNALSHWSTGPDGFYFVPDKVYKIVVHKASF